MSGAPASGDALTGAPASGDALSGAPASGGDESAGWQRLDKWLWCARFMRARTDCAALVAQGHLRINRQPTDKPHARLRVGDVVTLPLRGAVRVIKVRALANRRGPATEARALYQEFPPVEDAAVPFIPCGNSETPA